MAGCNGCEAKFAGLSNIELLPAFAQEAPACSLDGDSQSERAREFQAVFAWLRAADRDGASLRWVFQNGPGVERKVRQLARKEHACCPFLSFAISTRGDEVVWQARAMEGAEPLLDAFYDLPNALTQTAHPFERLTLRKPTAH
ncbi:MAG TPA: hypothetical protein VFZ61_03475 [Polyangiales bacterium]